MDTLLSAAHLRRELGAKLFGVIVSSDNTAAVRAFAQGLVEAAFPTEMVIAGVTYAIRHCLQGNEQCVNGDVFVARAKKMPGAAFGEADCQNLLDNYQDIPVTLRGNLAFIFTEWRHPDRPQDVAIVGWNGGQLVQSWHCLDYSLDGNDYVLLRK